MREARLMCLETKLITFHFQLNYMIISCTIEDFLGIVVVFWDSKLLASLKQSSNIRQEEELF